MSESEAQESLPARKVWLFATNMPRTELDALLDPAVDPEVLYADLFRDPSVEEHQDPSDEDQRGPIAVLLGADWLDHDFVEVIDPNNLGDMSLAEYLVRGIGIHSAQVAAIGDVLSALKFPVIAVFEDAFAGQPAYMHPSYRLAPLGLFTGKPGPIVYKAARLPSSQPRKPIRWYGALVAPVLIMAIVAWVYWGK